MRRRLISRSGYGVHTAARQLLQDIVLKRRRWHRSGSNDRERNPDPLGIEKEEQLVAPDRTSETASEVVHRGARLVVARRGVRKEISRAELRAVPQFIQISVHLVRSGLGHVIDLRGSIAPLIHRIGDRVHGHLRDRIQAQHQVGRKAAVQVRQRVVRLQAIDDIAV